MSDDLVKQADAFRLGSGPTDEQVNQANRLIDRMSSRIEELEAENERLNKIPLFAYMHGVEDGYSSQANAIWSEFKDKWDGERKYALRQIVKWLKDENDE